MAVNLPSTLRRLALISLGSNLGNSRKVIAEAIERLQLLSNDPLRKSSFWETSPVDCPRGSPPFVNAAVGLIARPDETPETLLEQLQSLEREFGRRPKQAQNEPRPLDLDLIAFGSEMRATPDLTLPHPRAHLRRFVLEPLREIAPEFVLPGQRRSIGDLGASIISDEVVRRIEPRSAGLTGVDHL